LDLEEAEAVGIVGSIARGDFTKKSDIDVFVVVKEKKEDTDGIWWRKISKSLGELGRDVTVIVYSVEGLKRIINWYVLRLASDGIIIYDRGGIKELFGRIIETAHRAGLVEKTIGGYKVWSAEKLNVGEELILEVK
jgi:predicted nucleotidyltransferase